MFTQYLIQVYATALTFKPTIKLSYIIHGIKVRTKCLKEHITILHKIKKYINIYFRTKRRKRIDIPLYPKVSKSALHVCL